MPLRLLRLVLLVVGAFPYASSAPYAYTLGFDAPNASAALLTRDRSVQAQARLQGLGTLAQASVHPVCGPHFVILTLYRESRTTMCNMFAEISQSIVLALEAHGNSASQCCCALEGTGTGCVGGGVNGTGAFVPGSSQVILLGAIELVRGSEHVNGPIMIPARRAPVHEAVLSGWLPSTTIVYQLDHISDGLWQGFNSIMKGKYIGYLRHFLVWEYAMFNMQSLGRDHNVAAVYCPLTHSPVYEYNLTVPWQLPVLEDFDVFFFGSVSDHRRKVLSRVNQVAGVKFTSLESGAWGADLAHAMYRSKIVLVLSAWHDKGEYKLSRLAPILANARFAIVENTAVWDDIGRFEGGLVVADTEDLGKAVLYYLDNPLERQRIAKRGQELFKAEHFSATMSRCLESTRKMAACAG